MLAVERTCNCRQGGHRDWQRRLRRRTVVRQSAARLQVAGPGGGGGGGGGSGGGGAGGSGMDAGWGRGGSLDVKRNDECTLFEASFGLI